MMKRMLAFAMSMAFMFSIVCGNSMEVKAEGKKCSHATCENYDTTATFTEFCDKCAGKSELSSVTPDNKGVLQYEVYKCSNCSYESTIEMYCVFQNGFCVMCKQSQNQTCFHENCNNPVDETKARCSSCDNTREKRYISMDENNHTFEYIYLCCNSKVDSVKVEVTPHVWGENGGCIYCGYGAKESNADSEESAPAPRISEEEAYLKKAAEREAKMKKEVKTANGTSIKTEIAGVYEVFSLNGTAVTTSKEDVKKAIGLTEEEIKAGTNASIYMTDDVKAADRELLKDAASSKGKKVLNMVISDMYIITKDGVITKLHNSKEPVSLMFGLPKDAVKGDRNYSVICVARDGSVVELEDTDKDASTVTIKTTVFGKYAIVY